ncbi:hypothetical protein MIN45_P1591 [Methylomarinovum tepidoasis]|uniref:Flagellar hook-length control protein-like C-terminal domain-containing protein n=1 Tax=Methylomarinovum tepidoasis TaxID=2840183 RepID=A0AAU9CEJ1_9GAMM|nr:flagellar hook-length control protein FliK [Methylomarinovum sp. IN45]BCX89221.1 hypothetical protein MIN45_P1591 [Methylomarinovum sp. IN45]
MEIRRALQTLIPVLGRASAPSQPVLPLQALQPGQRIQARVLAQTGPNQVMLEMLGSRVIADTQIPLPAGKQVQLEVVQGGQQPQLRALPPPSGGDAPAQLLRNVLPQQRPLAQSLPPLLQLADDPWIPEPVRRQLEQLRQALPRQAELVSPDRLRQAIRRSGLFADTATEEADASQLKPDLKRQLRQLADTLRERPALPPRTAATRVLSAQEDAGNTNHPTPSPQRPASTPLRMEPPAPARPPSLPLPSPGEPQLPLPTHMAMPSPPLAATSVSSPSVPDEPPGRQPAAASVPPEAPPQGEEAAARTLETLLDSLSRKVTAALARITVDQLASLPHPDRPETVWHLEIPYHDDQRLEVLTLVIKREQERNGADAEAPRPLWSVDLELQPASLGTIRARIVLSGKQISSYFWGERPDTQRLFARHLERLERRLSLAGLTPARLQVTERPLPAPEPEPPATEPLLNEEA